MICLKALEPYFNRKGWGFSENKFNPVILQGESKKKIFEDLNFNIIINLDKNKKKFNIQNMFLFWWKS